ncbi:MAG: hypothetical protein H0X24_11795 [Ktedonobacterales bacterium]|nr:hypothetical protein [Ktedonobacterales bacterium]
MAIVYGFVLLSITYHPGDDVTWSWITGLVFGTFLPMLNSAFLVAATQFWRRERWLVSVLKGDVRYIAPLIARWHEEDALPWKDRLTLIHPASLQQRHHWGFLLAAALSGGALFIIAPHLLLTGWGVPGGVIAIMLITLPLLVWFIFPPSSLKVQAEAIILDEKGVTVTRNGCTQQISWRSITHFVEIGMGYISNEGARYWLLGKGQRLTFALPPSVDVAIAWQILATIAQRGAPLEIALNTASHARFLGHELLGKDPTPPDIAKWQPSLETRMAASQITLPFKLTLSQGQEVAITFVLIGLLSSVLIIGPGFIVHDSWREFIVRIEVVAATFFLNVGIVGVFTWQHRTRMILDNNTISIRRGKWRHTLRWDEIGASGLTHEK